MLIETYLWSLASTAILSLHFQKGSGLVSPTFNLRLGRNKEIKDTSE
jgi:hypothetical protein